MTDIYEQHDKAFSQVSAYVILKDGARVATVAFKFPKDGAGRLYAYVHWFGTQMVRGYAGGYGYDKRSAAVAEAARKLTQADMDQTGASTFVQALCFDGGSYWDNRLMEAGFEVFQAV